MKTYVRIKSKEYAAQVRFRMADPNFGGRRTATVTMQGTAQAVKELFEGIDSWITIKRDEAGTEIKAMDCSNYEKLLMVQDHLDGTASAVFGQISAEELLQILLGGEADG